MRLHRVKFRDPQAADGVYHCMSRTVNGELCLGTREKEVFRKMLHQVADFSGVEVLTYCIMRNHFHILLRVFQAGPVPDAELVRRFGVLCPKTTKYQSAKAKDVELILKVMEAGGGCPTRVVAPALPGALLHGWRDSGELGVHRSASSGVAAAASAEKGAKDA